MKWLDSDKKGVVKEQTQSKHYRMLVLQDYEVDCSHQSVTGTHNHAPGTM